MIYITFTDEQVNELDYERYHYPDPRVQKRMEMLYLKSQGMSHGEICRLCRVTKTTLAKYLKTYRDGGIEGLKVFNYKGTVSELTQHADTIKAHFEQHPPHTVAQAVEMIERLTGIRRSATQVRLFMKRLGMKFRKTGAIPGKVMDEGKLQEQEDFERNQLQPRLQEAEDGTRAVFFC
jgi:transposase